MQPRTRQRYEASLQQFFSWLEREGLALPKRVAQMDNLVSDYLEYLWADGHGKSEANNALAALQDFDPNLRRKLPGSWRLAKSMVNSGDPQPGSSADDGIARCPLRLGCDARTS